MTTIADAIVSALDSGWVNGTKPTLLNTEDYRSDLPASDDMIVVQNYSLETRIDPLNDEYSNKTHRITLRCSTSDATDREARLDDIMDEAERILNNDGVTGFSTVKVVSRSKAATDKRVAVWRGDLVVEMKELVTSSKTAAGSTSISTITVDELTVNSSSSLATATADSLSVSNAITAVSATIQSLTADQSLKLGLTVTEIKDEDDMISDASDALATQQSIKAYVDAMNGIGSSNKQYIACLLHGGSAPANKIMVGNNWAVTDVDSVNNGIMFLVPLPPSRGGKSLWIDAFRIIISQASATDYVTRVRISHVSYSSVTTFGDEQTDRTAAGAYLTTFTAHDCSASASAVMIYVEKIVSASENLDIRAVQVRYYYV